MNDRTIEILLIEDDEAHAELIRRAFEINGGEMNLTVAPDLREARACIAKRSPDLVIADLLLPDGKGVDIFPGDGRELPFPVVILTAHGDEQAAVDSMKAGALDYVVKTESAFAEMPHLAKRILREWDLIVERRRADEALEHERAFLQTVIDTIPDATIVVNLDRRIVLANRSARKAAGEDPVASHLTCHQMLYGYDVPPADEEGACPLEMVVASRAPATTIHISNNASAEGTLLEVSAAPILDEGGQVRQIVLSCRDITERLRSEMALRESEQRYRSLFENSPIVLWEEDFSQVKRRIDRLRERGVRDFGAYFSDHPEEVAACAEAVRIVDVNQASLRVYEAESKQQLLAGLPQILTEKALDTFRERLVHMAKGGQSLERETTNRTITGKEIDLALRWFIPPKYADTWARVIVSAVDMTDYHRAQDALRESEEKYHSIFETAANLIISMDPKGTILDCNSRTVEVLGCTQKELIGQNIAKIIHLEDLLRMQDCLGGMASEGPVHESEYRMVRKDGGIINVIVNPSALRDPDGKFVQSICIISDITERKQIEEQLRQSQKMEAVGLLAGGVAHDFRNQLTVIRGYGEMLLRQKRIAEKDRELVEEILNAVGRSSMLTKELLAFGGKQILRPEVIDLDAFITALAKTLARMIGEDVMLSLDLAGDLGSVKVDAGQLQQAVVNLALNARDAMPQGGRIILKTSNVRLDCRFVERHPGAAAGPHALLTVSDTGSGMDAETLGKIFEPFFTTKPVGEGTGLGLSMVYGFVKQSGGHIAVQSKPRNGTTFKIYLPRVKEPAKAPAAVTAPGKLRRGSGNILLVEDEEPIRELTARTLRECGYTVIESGNAREALPVGEHYDGPIDMLITDVIMPGMDGVRLAGIIGKARPDMKVLYISGYPDKTLADHGIADEAVNLLSKPFDARALAERVGHILAEAASPA